MMTNTARTLLVATTNQKKLIELQTLLADMKLELLCLSDLPAYEEIPETGNTFEENATLKALGYAWQTGYLTVAEDSGLCCDALNGGPGVYSARFAGLEKDDDANNAKLLKMMENVEAERRTAHYTSVVAIARPDHLVGVAEGCVYGQIHTEALGNGGFGYDPIFFYPPYGKTFGQVSAEMKHKVSHRAMALSKAKELLQEHLDS
jgi:XTP/dITP diphosphohydrolase